MGTRTTDDGSLYKPTVGETGYGAVTNTNFDRLGRQTTQIKLVSESGPIFIESATFLFVTTGQLAANAKWSIGASNRYDFGEESLNLNFNGGAEPERNPGSYAHSIDLSLAGLTLDKIGAGAPVSSYDARALLAIWEQDPDTLSWVIVATTWLNIESAV